MMQWFIHDILPLLVNLPKELHNIPYPHLAQKGSVDDQKEPVKVKDKSARESPSNKESFKKQAT